MLSKFSAGNGGAPNAPAGDDLVKEGSDASFMKDVIEASRKTPVIVDFWATWCGPCRQLGPALEKAVRDLKGKVRMVKIDVDKNPQFAGQLRVQSIPAVFAFSGGQVVDGFMGALPPGELKKFLDRVLAGGGARGRPGAAAPDEAEAEDDGPTPEEIEAALTAADESVARGAIGEAAQIYAQILSFQPDNLKALAGMAKAYSTGGDFARARSLLGQAPADKKSDPVIVQALAALDMAEKAKAMSARMAEFTTRLARDPNDHQARFDHALALMGMNKREEAVNELLELFRRDREWNEQAARKELLKIFEALGAKDPVALAGRRRLSSLVFS